MGMLVRALLVGAAYLLAARQAVLLHDVSGLGAIFWPGAGITVTGLLLSPRRWWPAIVAAVGLAELGNDLLTGFALVPSLWWSAANMTEGLSAAWLIQRWRADGFDTVRAMAWFFAAAFVASNIGAAIGAIGTTVSGPTGAVSSLPYLVTAGQWVIGDGVGILTVVPFGLLLFGRIPAASLRSVEAVLAIGAVLAASVLVFGLGTRSAILAADYVVLLPLVWAAVRLRVAGAAVALFIVAQIVNVATSFDRGPFAGWAPVTVEASAQAQLFLIAVSATALLLACRSAERAGFEDLALAREHLVAAVSHELRTPLTAIVGFSETMLRRPGLDEASTHEAAEVIHRNGVHLAALVDDLLRASRARRGALVSQPEPVELDAFLREILALRGDASVESSVPSGVHAFADPTHLHQIVSNLLDNALRHGRPPVCVEVMSAGGRVEIAVTDHGDGVAQQFVPFLFDEFSQASTGDRRTTLGLGLGLSLARELARAEGGDLVLRPSPVGACFVVFVPEWEAGPFVAGDGVVGRDGAIGDGAAGDADAVRRGLGVGP